MTSTREDWLQMVAHSLLGPRRRRRRLLAELEGHLDDAAAEELAAGLAPADAEAAALRRLGAPDAVAADWNVDVAARRTATRLRIVVLAVLASALLAPVALAQRSGPSHPHPVKPTPVTIKQERGAAPARGS